MTRSLFGRYLPRRSAVHDLDPRVKIAGAVALSLVVLQGALLTLALISAALAVVARAAHIPPGRLLEALAPARLFLVLLFVLHLLFTEGTPLPPFADAWVTVTREGLLQGFLVSWRFAVLLATGAILTMSTSPSALVDGLERLLRPLRVLGIRSHDLALMVSLALRFVPALLEEMHSVREAQAARGAAFRGGIGARARAAASLILPVAQGAFRKGDELAAAMEARGYCGGARTGLRELRLAPRDWTAAGMMVLFLAGVAGI